MSGRLKLDKLVETEAHILIGMVTGQSSREIDLRVKENMRLLRAVQQRLIEFRVKANRLQDKPPCGAVCMAWADCGDKEVTLECLLSAEHEGPHKFSSTPQDKPTP